MSTPKLFTGGQLIRQFDGFRRLIAHAGDALGTPFHLSEEAMVVCNRVLAALGGPPAKAQVTGQLSHQGVALLSLFLLTQELPARVGYLGDGEVLLGQLKSLAHVLGHSALPMIGASEPLPFQAVVKELGPNGTQFRPLLRYDLEGEPTGFEPEGAPGSLVIGPDGGGYTLAILAAAGPAPLAQPGEGLHPSVLVLG
ncbi:MAG TPA: hypothetical protein VK191_16665 [Symbiobacteriaceae bacterium]|nr:hypothetical protein [Symbiobacteriaceae bacterium]